jgi:hypothetical protein
MKRVASISEHLNDEGYSYTGKGNFEAIVKKHSSTVVEWLENLIPLKTQIDKLNELENVDFQKRNYIRILNKYHKKEYSEFVDINILVRDKEAMKEYYKKTNSELGLYNQLINNNYLKYPGRSQKHVPIERFKEFLTVYKDDLEIYFEESVMNNTQTSSKSESKKTNWTKLLLGEK